MDQKGIDLRTLFVKVKLKNTDKRGNVEDSSFDTTDIAYLRSEEEIENIPQEKRPKSPSDFALSNFAEQSYYMTENGKYAGSVLTRSASDIFAVKTIEFDGAIDWRVADDAGAGSPVSLGINAKALVSMLKTTKNIKITSKKVGEEEKHFIKLGEYPGKIASPDMQKMLEEAYNNGSLQDGLTCTGRLYTTNGQSDEDGVEFLSKQNPEFEFNGEKYVRVVVRTNFT